LDRVVGVREPPLQELERLMRYTIIPERSRVWIDARSSMHPIHSTTDGLEGFVDLDADGHAVVGPHPTAQLSFPVKRLSSGNRFEDRELHRRIDAERYSIISGVLTGVVPVADGDGFLVRGDLTFRGVTRSVEDYMTLTAVDDGTIRLAGESTFDIRDFGMEPPRILMLRVHPEVKVRVEILAAS
jgi:polyisoprenoid-binding protein YceI